MGLTVPARPPVRSEAFLDVASMPSGTPAVATSGQPIATYGANSAGPTISGGRLTFTPQGASITAAYTNVLLARDGVKIGARFRLAAGGATGSACVAFFASPVSGGAIPNSPVHLTSTLSGWSFGVWSGGSWSLLASGSYATALTAGADYVMEATVDKPSATCVIRLPDGTFKSVTDSRIASLSARYACWESYVNTSGDAVASFDSCWADSEPSVATSALPVAAPLILPRRSYAMVYAPTGVSLSVGASSAAVDSTNFTLPVTPAGTKMLVTVQIYLTVSTSTRYFMNMKAGSVETGDIEAFLGVPAYGLITVSGLITGLTAGSAVTIIPWHWRTTSGVSALGDAPNARRWSIVATDV